MSNLFYLWKRDCPAMLRSQHNFNTTPSRMDRQSRCHICNIFELFYLFYRAVTRKMSSIADPCEVYISTHTRKETRLPIHIYSVLL